MARAKRDDDDDDDFVPRVGRPRTPEQFGPPRPEPYQREPYARHLKVVLDALEIGYLGPDERMYLQRIMWRTDRLRDCYPDRFPARGEDSIVLTLRSITESTNGCEALVLPIIKAISSCTHEAWVNSGSWFEALDELPLLETLKVLRILGIEDQLERVVRQKLYEMLGPPVAAAPKKKPPTRTMARPPNVSPDTGAEVMELHKAAKRETQRRRKARMAA